MYSCDQICWIIGEMDGGHQAIYSPSCLYVWAEDSVQGSVKTDFLFQSYISRPIT